MPTMLGIVQPVPSPTAKPVKLRCANVGRERIKETADPSIALDRSCECWKRQGRSGKWIERRLRGQDTRTKLAGCGKEHGIEPGRACAILPGIIHQARSGLAARGTRI